MVRTRSDDVQEKAIDRGHQGIRDALRIIGPMVAAVGLILMGIGIVSAVGSIGSFGPPRHFWCLLVGMPLLFVGVVLTGAGFMGKVMRYQAQEMAPVAKDTFNYMADGTKDGVKTMASALGRGLAEGGLGSGGTGEAKVRCHKCNALEDTDAKFCSQCGEALGKSKACPTCQELNDPDAKFCDHCGHAYP